MTILISMIQYIARLAFFLVLSLPYSLSAGIIYVNGSYAGDFEDGASWDTPYKTISAALAAASANDQIWIAKGTYLSSEGGLQGFHIDKSIKLYGSFNGTESSVFARDIENNKTILQGDTSQSGKVFAMEKNVELSLDGFDLTKFSYGITHINPTGNFQFVDPDTYNLNINNCSFYNSSNHAIEFLYTSNIEIYNSKFYNIRRGINIVGSSPSGSHLSNLKLVNVEVYECSSGEFIFGYQIKMEAVRCSIHDNNFNSFFLDGNSQKSGDLKFTDCLFENNNGRFVNANATTGEKASLSLEGCTVNSNSYNDIIYITGRYQTSIRNCFFKNNISNHVIACYSQYGLSMEDCVFESNNSVLDFSPYTSSEVIPVSIKNCRFNDNLSPASNYLIKVSVSTKTLLEIDDSEFVNNKLTDSSPGAKLLFLSGNLLDARIYRSTFRDNEATNGSAGVLYSVAGKLQIDECSFEGNKAVGAGVMYIATIMSGERGLLKNSRFINNSAATYGAIQTHSDLEIINCEFKGNSAPTGQAGVFYGTSSTNFTGCLFEANYCNFAGAVLAYSGTHVLRNCIFRNNFSPKGGTGAFATAYGSARLYNCLFDGNKSLYTSDTTGAAAISIYYPLELYNCTFVRNSTNYKHLYSGRGEVISGSVTVMMNTIIWNNGTRQPLNDYYPSSSYKTLYSNIQGGFPGEGNTDLDPKFVDFNGGNFRLSCESPLINKGKNEGFLPPTDLDQLPRIYAGTVDMGAYEFPQDPATASTPPQVAFSAPASACRSEYVNFTNETIPVGNIRFEWDFGDGSFSNATNPTHNFANAGTYIVKLKAINPCGANSQTTRSITVIPSFAPVINYETLVCPGAVNEFTTNANCSSLAWAVEGGTILSGNGSNTISVVWGDGSAGNGSVNLLATECGSGMCESPVSITVPIVPVNFEMTGPVKLCQGASGTYETKVKDISPSTLYTWKVKGGNIFGKSFGYNLHTVTVQFSNSDTLGIVYLTTFNEMLRCGKTDSFMVELRPKFNISGPQIVCESASHDYNIEPSSDIGSFLWSVSGNNIINADGLIQWGNSGGEYRIIAAAMDESKVCNTSDTLHVELLNKPVISGIQGDIEVDPNVSQVYTAMTDADEIDLTWQVTGGVMSSAYGKSIVITWGQEPPYSITATAKLIKINCTSDAYQLTVYKNFIYTVTGPDTACIGTQGIFSANTDPDFPTLYNWTSSFAQVLANGHNYTVTFDKPGMQVIQLTAERNGRTYRSHKQVYVKAAHTDIALKGMTEIDPSGTGTYIYTVTNSNNLQYNYSVSGAASHSRSGNEIAVTWGGNGPFSISAVGIVPGNTCTGVPAVLNVSKANDLPNQINSQGSPCLYSRVRYSFIADKHTSNLRWSISGGGTVTGNINNEITVEWSATGNHTVSLLYDRFGPQSSSLQVTVFALPVPEISNGTICGNNPLSLSTTIPYASYQWFEEPSASVFSSDAHPAVMMEGLYRVEIQDGNGCRAFASKYIKQIPLPKAKIFSEEDLVYCQQAGESRTVKLKTFEGQDYHYEWMKNDQIAGAPDSPVYEFTLPLSAPSSANYKVKVSLEGCVQISDPVSVTVFSTSYCSGGGGGGCAEPPVSIQKQSVSGCMPFTFTAASSATDFFGWNFGDGTSSSLKNPPAKEYKDVGIYSVRLSRKCQSDMVRVEVPAVALFKLDAPGCKGQTLDFNDLSVNIPGRTIISWNWNFGDGSSLPGSGSGERDAQHVFADTGTYQVSLTVVALNASGATCTHTFTKPIRITAPPEVNFTVQSPPCTGNIYKFIDASTYQYSKAEYRWEFPNAVTSALPDPYHSFTPGTHPVKLKVTDLLGCSGEKTISIQANAPVAVGRITASDSVLCNGKTITLTASGGSGHVWKKDDTEVGTGTSIDVTAAGAYTVTYLSSGCQVITAPAVLKDYAVPNLISGNKDACLDEPFSIASNLSSSRYSFAWKHNSEALTATDAALLIPSTTLTHTGDYTLTVTDKANGCAVSFPPYNITVHEKPVKPLLISSHTQTCYNGSITLSAPVETDGKTFTWFREQIVLPGSDTILHVENIVTAGNYYVSVTENTTGCVSLSERVLVNVAPQIQVSIEGDTLVCESAPAVIGTSMSSTDYDFQWYKNGLPVNVTMPRLGIINAVMGDTGTYYMKATSKGTSNLAGCFAFSDSITLKVAEGAQTPVITGPAEFCSGNTVTLATNLLAGFTWNTGAVTPEIEVSQGGVYSVTSVNPVSGCKKIAFANVAENPVPDLSFFPAGVYERCASDKIFFDGLNTYTNYNWYVNGVKFSSGNNNLYPTLSGKYSLEVFTDKNCVAYSDTMRITSLECPCFVTHVNDSGIGSLREALECSNSKPGKDVIKFTIAGAGPFVIQPHTPLPLISDSVFIDGFSQSGYGIFDVVLDGTYYKEVGLKVKDNLANNKISGMTFRNFDKALTLSNSVSNTVIEENIFSSNTVSAIEVMNNSHHNSILKNTIQSSGTAISLLAARNNRLTGNTISSSEVGIGMFNGSGFNVVSSNEITGNSQFGIQLATGSSSNSISLNTVGGSGRDGIFLDNFAADNTIDSNFIGTRYNGISLPNGKNGIYVGLHCNGSLIKRNTIGNNAENGIFTGSLNTDVRNNYIGINSSGNAITNQKCGVLSIAEALSVSDNLIANNTEYGVSAIKESAVRGNVIRNNHKGGIHVTAEANRFSQNIITNTDTIVKAIDLHFVPGPAANEGKLPATFTKYRRSANGIVLSGISLANDSVEVFYNNNAPQQALIYAGSAKANAGGIWELEIPEGAAFDPNKKNYYVNTATDPGSNTSELSSSFMTGCFNCICLVTNTNDNGEGSFRAEVDSANTGSCLTVNFAIAGPDTITIQSPVSAITVPVTINGIPGSEDPRIFLKGNSVFNGVSISADGVHLNNLGFTGFGTALTITGSYNSMNRIDAVYSRQPVRIEGDHNELTASAINTFRESTPLFSSDTLIYITGNHNIIGKAGQPNKIVHADDFGVLVNGGKNNSILYNSIYGNRKGIAHSNSGNNSFPAPHTIVGTTLGSVSTVTGKATPGSTVQLFVSTYDAEQAYEFAVEVITDGNGNWTAGIPSGFIIPDQNNYFVATATDSEGNTSPLSQPVRVGSYVQKCYVTNTLNTGKGSLRDAVDCANLAGTGQGVPAVIIFQLPETPNEIIISSGYTITNNYGVKVNPYKVPVSIKALTKDFAGFTWATNSLEIKNLTFDNFGTGLNCKGKNAVIDSNLFINSGSGIVVNALSASDNQTFTNNFFVNGKGGILVQRGSLNARGNTIGKDQNGVSGPMTGFGIAVHNSNNLQLVNNTIENVNTGIDPDMPAAYNGVSFYVKDSRGNVANNTFKGAGSTTNRIVVFDNFSNSRVTGNVIGNAHTGVMMQNSKRTEFTNNQFTQVTANGIGLISSDSILISRNTVSGLLAGNKPIDLHLSGGQASNQSKQAPVILTASYHDGQLHLIGEAEKGDLIELFYSDAVQSDLNTYIGTASADSVGIWKTSLAIAADQAKDHFFRATAKSGWSPRTSEASVAFHSNLTICLVTVTDDSGDGSLRDAIDKANANTCNLIQFDIPGVADIQPVTDLPLITTPTLIIDATSQPGYSKGTPAVHLIGSGSQATALSTRNSTQFSLYGMKISGAYDTAVAVTGATLAELNDNEFDGYVKAAIRFTSSSSKYGNILDNKIRSEEGEYGMHLNGGSHMVVNGNSIAGFASHGIFSASINQKIINNTLTAANTATANGISLSGSSGTYVYNNVVDKAFRGISVVNGSRDSISNNILGTLDPADLSAGIFINDAAVHIENSSRCRVYSNIINGSQNGVYIKGSAMPLVQNTKAKNVGTRVVSIIDCDRSIVSYNNLDSVKTGIYVSGSRKTLIQGNIISSIEDYGIFLDTGADSSLFMENVIGGEYFQSPHYSTGEGIHIKSSDNVIGGIDADNATNYIFHNTLGGIVIEGGLRNRITHNVIFENDKTKGRPSAYAIELKSSGNKNQAKPFIEEHEWAGGKLVLKGNAKANDSIHVYLGEGGYEEARIFMGSGFTQPDGKWQVDIDTAQKVKPKTTLYLTATATDPDNNTSPLSDMYILGDCYITSLKDTADNDYPMPNSLRMAVKCANGQKNHVGIFFNVNEYGNKDVELQMKLQPIRNPYGVTFNAKNLITDQVMGGIDGSKLLPGNDTAWVISAVQGASVFDSLRVLNFRNGIKVLADSISFRGFRFTGIEETALFAGAQAGYLQVAGSVFESEDNATAISLTAGAGNVTISNNRFATLKDGISSQGNDFLTIHGNTFGLPDLPVLNSISVRDAEGVSIYDNTFLSKTQDHKAIHWDMVQGNIRGNSFRCNKTDNPVYIINSESFSINDNSFHDSSAVYLRIENSDHGSVSGNYFQRPDDHSIQVKGSEKIDLIRNLVANAPQDAFDIIDSRKVLISRNTIHNVRYNISARDSALCINIHKDGGAGVTANDGKEEPVNLNYAVKPGVDGRRGLFVQGKAEPGDSVEVFFSDSLSASMNSYVVTAITPASGLWEVKIPRDRYVRDTTTWYHCVAVAIGPDSNTSQTSGVLHIPPVFDVFYVRNTYDAGANSLRDALLQVNSSDLFSKVVFQIDWPEFQPGPYRIELDSLIDPVYSYMGYLKDGNSQLPHGFGADKRIVVEAGSIGNNYAFDLTDSSDFCVLSNMWFNNARKGARIANKKNKIANFHFMTSEATMKQDTALMITGSENEFKGLSVSNYYKGIILADAASENTVEGSLIDSTDFAVIATDSAHKNIVNKLTILNSYETAILADSAGPDNVFSNNTIGNEAYPAIGIGVKVNNSESQTFTDNIISHINPYADGRPSAAFAITGRSSFNYLYGNTIGINPSDTTIHRADVRGFALVPSADGVPSRNSLVSNVIAGTGGAAIYAEHSSGDLIAENLIGVDRSKTKVPGVDSTAILLRNCMDTELSDNLIRGYAIYGIDLRKSDHIRMNRNIVNSTITLNKGININASSSDESNGGLIVPVITGGVLIDTQTVRISGTALPGVDVEVYQSVKDTIQSVAYVNKVVAETDATGIWVADVPNNYFSFAGQNCFVAQNHEGSRSSEFSNSYMVRPLLCQLAEKAPALLLLEPSYHPCPGPVFKLNGVLDEGLTFKWKSDRWADTLLGKHIELEDTATNLVLKITDDFGCVFMQSTEVLFKGKPIYPDFIVSSEVYAGDTIVLVDVSLPVPTEYTWISSPGVSIVNAGTTNTFTGEDGKVYPEGRFVQFILPDSGSFNITQKSLRDGCFVELKKDLEAGPKKPGDTTAYYVAPEIQSLSAYPNPSDGLGIEAFVKVGVKDPVTLMLASEKGEVMWTRQLSGQLSYTITLPDINDAGLYLLKLSTAKREIVFKLVVTNNK